MVVSRCLWSRIILSVPSLAYNNITMGMLANNFSQKIIHVSNISALPATPQWWKKPHSCLLSSSASNTTYVVVLTSSPLRLNIVVLLPRILCIYIYVVVTTSAAAAFFHYSVFYIVVFEADKSTRHNRLTFWYTARRLGHFLQSGCYLLQDCLVPVNKSTACVTHHRRALSPISVISNIGLSLISEPPISD